MGAWFVFASIGIWFISKYEITRSLQAAEVDVLEQSDAGTEVWWHCVLNMFGHNSISSGQFRS